MGGEVYRRGRRTMHVLVVYRRLGNFHVKNNSHKKIFVLIKFSWFCLILEIFLRKMFYLRVKFSWLVREIYFNSEIFPI